MKKLLAILVLGLLLNGCAAKPYYNINKHNSVRDPNIKILDVMPSNAKFINIVETVRCNRTAYYEFATSEDVINDLTRYAAKAGADGISNIKVSKNNPVTSLLRIGSCWSRLTGSANAFKYTTTASSTTTTEDITFTIDDKKEQCKAIGFEPATEKFADCVLRLVELDVSSQQLKQIALAESQGNQQIADELRKQRKAQSSRYLMELGKQLSTPKAPASLPSTRTCSISGSGANKTVTCW